MKKIYIAIAALALMGGCVLTGCSNSGNEGVEAVVVPGDTATYNVRYVNIDSVLNNYALAKELTAEQQKVMLEYQNLENQKGSELQRMQNTMAQKYQSNGYLSQESFQADQDNLQRKAAEAEKLLRTRQQQIANVVEQQTARVNDSIRNYMKALCELNNIDVVVDEKVAYYVNPKYDITSVVIEGLNKRYKGEAPADTVAAKK